MRAQARHEIDRTMIRLRAAGLSYPAISVVLDLYHGWRLPPSTIRARCRQLGVAPRPQGRGNVGWPHNGWCDRDAVAA